MTIQKKRKITLQSSIEIISTELLLKICIEYLGLFELLTIRQLNKKWKNIIDSIPQFWRHVKLVLPNNASKSLLKNHIEGILSRSKHNPDCSVEIGYKTLGSMRNSTFISLDLIWNWTSKIFHHLKSIAFKMLSLSESSISSLITGSTKKQFDLFHVFPGLCELCLVKCKIPIIFIAYMMTSCPNITSIHIIDCILDSSIESLPIFHKLTTECKSVIRNAKFPHLKHIAISGHFNSSWNLNDLLNWMIYSTDSQIISISLDRCTLSSSLLIKCMVLHGKSLEIFHLNRCKIISPETPDFGMSFGLLKKIKSLSLSSMNEYSAIGPSMFTTLIDGLREIDISYSLLTDRDLIRLGKLNPGLIRVNLEGCQKISEDAIMIFLKSCSMIEHINISRCLFSSDTLLEALVKGRIVLSSLCEIIMRYPVSLSLNCIVSFLEIYGKKLKKFDISGQSTLSIELLSHCRTSDLLSDQCEFHMNE